ncbi:MAG: nucleotide exchange factor GrpE [Oscillospiraceae bacterium]|jgi:molecular chaperone GrpE|nr:nucleotide exchange factor GrpE [Oscillospiraceae bacterium]
MMILAKTPRGKVQEEEPLELELEQEAETCGPGCEACGGDCAASPDADGADAGAAEDAIAAERDKYLRLAAEYDNFRKRSVKEREALYTQVRSDTIAKLLPVYDNLARALKQECADEAFYKGVEMTMTGLCEILSGMGVEEIESVGAKFDPERHRALAHFEDPELGEGAITEEFEKGFTFGGKVIRFAAVAVAN